MNDLQVFSNSEFGELNVLVIDGKEHFPATDCARILGYANPQEAIRTHCKGVREFLTPTQGGQQNVRYIPEGDLYRLIVRSHLPTAERFEAWVFDEVIPQIRKTGTYTMRLPQNYGEALRELANVWEEKEALKETIAIMAPKAEFFDAVADSKDAIDIGCAAKLLDRGIGRTKMFKFLRDKQVLMQNNIPYQEFIDRGYFRVIEQSYSKPDGTQCTSRKTLVYQKGLDFIRRLLDKESNKVVAIGG